LVGQSATTEHDALATQGTPESQPTTEIDSNSTNTALDLELMAEALLNATTDNFPDHVDSLDFTRKKAQLATTKPYLMHEMLAVSGLYLFSKNASRRELMTRALYHQSEALRLIQSQLSSTTTEDNLAMLFFSSFTALVGLAEPALCDTHDESFDPIEKVLHAFQLSRGIATLVMPCWSDLRQTWAWKAIQSQIEAGSDLTPQPQSVPGYTHLRCLAFGLENETDRQACIKALDFTLGAISLVQQREDMSMSRRLVTSWPIETGATFHKLLTDRRPVSLVIIAYYAALLKLGIGLWWVGRYPEALVKYIAALLGEEWTEFLNWPKSIVLDEASEPAIPSEPVLSTT
jgi:hypothetical protein